jgi:hypothetical protein
MSGDGPGTGVDVKQGIVAVPAPCWWTRAGGMGPMNSERPIDVIGSGVTIADDGEPFPTVVLDVTDRPDVADLARVHDADGIGDLVSHARPADGAVILTVDMTSPVVAVFSVRVEVPAHLEVLVRAAAAGHLLLATTAPTALGEDARWLAIDLDGGQLAGVLAAVTQG